MKNLFKCGILNSNSYKILSNSQFLSPRVFQLFYISNLSSNPHKNSKKLGKNGDLNKPGDPLFDEILRIMDTEGIEFDRNSPRVFSAMKDINFEGNAASLESSPCRPKGVCGNADQKKDLSFPLEDSGSRVSDEIESMEVGSIVLRVIETVRCENALLSMEERLENAGCRYSEEVVVNVLKKCFKVPHLALRFFNWVKLREGFRHTTNTFNVMINVAGEAEEFGLVEELVEEMGKTSCEKNLKTWTILVSHYGSRKCVGKALLVFEEMKRAGVEPDAIAYRTMLRALCNARKADLALEFYKDMVRNEVNLDVDLYKQLVKCFSLCGNIDAAHLVGEDLIKLEIPKPQVYGIMLKSFCIAGKITESLELIRDLRNKDVSLETGMFEALVRGLCSRDRIADAMEILEIMKRRNVFDQNIYGILISAYLGRNQVSEAFGLFQEAKGYGNVLVSTYTNLMQHCFWKNEFHKGLELYSEMLRLGLRLDSVAITAVAAGYIQQNRISEALEVFKGMNEMGITPASKSHTILIKEVCKICKADEVVEVLNEMQVCKLSNLDDILSEVRSYLEKKGEVEKLNAIRSIKEKNVDHRSNQSELTENTDTNPVLQRRRACSVESETRLNDCPRAEEVRQILSSSDDWCSIQENLEKLRFQFTPDLVVEVLRSCSLNIGIALKFFAWIGKQPDYSHNEQSYNMAMKIAGQGKNFKQMRSLFYEMRRRGCSITADTWTIMIMQYGRTGLTDLALSSFKEMKLSTCKPTKSTYSSLIASLCGKKGRKVDVAIQIYEEMVQAGRAPDKELLEAYVGCLCEVNKLSDARRCVESLHRFGFSTPLSYSLYVRALCRAGKLDDALALVDEVGCEKNLLQQYTYGSLVHGLLRGGRVEEALGKINGMKQLGFHPTVHVYTSLIIHFLKERDINRALATLEEMKEQGLQPTVVTYSALVCGYVRLGKVGDAWEVFRRLKQKGPLPDFKTYSMFIDCLCRAGESEDAFTLIPEMLRDGIVPSTVNFRTVVYGLNREGKADLARAVLKKKLDLKRRRQVVT
ncbi:putative pentatricopeptide repeat-containing protein At5g06400, mitochondrial [Salvia miltiorrhiza]|uniref:putative pentatricopeptide repeat-containing protein At5g06400, mitochondrial n=1 Tax=Salvia miltiorrhiza TaxID=226208 RepID=UPI0025AD8A04|nr:putative pentatricopeptide repeat-containing protein At5g06400, mitochondrial [Salvia miltiorrhiza]